MLLDQVTIITGSANNNVVLTPATQDNITNFTTPEQGEIVYKVDENEGVYYYSGTSWNKLTTPEISFVDSLPTTGTTGLIYVSKTDGSVYYWNGTEYKSNKFLLNNKADVVNASNSPVVYADTAHKISETLLPSGVIYKDSLTGKIKLSDVPAIVITEVFVVDGTVNTTWKTTLTANGGGAALIGSVVILSDQNTAWIKQVNTGAATDWIQMHVNLAQVMAITLADNTTHTGIVPNIAANNIDNGFSTNQTFRATATFQNAIISNVADGTAPLQITSKTVVPNLNVKLVNGVPVDNTLPTDKQILSYDNAGGAAKWITVPSGRNADDLTLGTIATERLASTGVEAGTYTKLTVDIKGRALFGATPTNIADLGITDVYNKTAADGAITTALSTFKPSFDTISNKPTTIAGYGITDAYTKTETDGAVSTAITNYTPNFATINNKPTTVVGYGITDAYTKTEVDNAITTSMSTFVVPYSAISGKPNTVADFGILDAYTKSQVDALLSTMPVSFTNLTNKPNSISGYGITDAYTKLNIDDKFTGLAVPFSKINTLPDTLAGYGIIDGVSTTALNNAVSSAITSYAPSFNIISGKPTTLTGYGITDAVSKSQLGAATSGDIIGVSTLDSNGKVLATQLPAKQFDINTVNINDLSDDFQLTNASARLQHLRSTKPIAIRLPAASLLSVGGLQFVLNNNGIFNMVVRDAAGNKLVDLPPNKTIAFLLVDNASPIGTVDINGTPVNTSLGVWVFLTNDSHDEILGAQYDFELNQITSSNVSICSTNRNTAYYSYASNNAIHVSQIDITWPQYGVANYIAGTPVSVTTISSNHNNITNLPNNKLLLAYNNNGLVLQQYETNLSTGVTANFGTGSIANITISKANNNNVIISYLAGTTLTNVVYDYVTNTIVGNNTIAGVLSYSTCAITSNKLILTYCATDGVVNALVLSYDLTVSDTYRVSEYGSPLLSTSSFKTGECILTFSNTVGYVETCNLSYEIYKINNEFKEFLFVGDVRRVGHGFINSIKTIANSKYLIVAYIKANNTLEFVQQEVVSGLVKYRKQVENIRGVELSLTSGSDNEIYCVYTDSDGYVHML